jgi:hypothetical protein
LITIRADPEEDTVGVAYPPKALIVAGGEGSDHIDDNIHDITRRNDGRQGDHRRCPHPLSAKKGYRVGLDPGTGAGILQSPDLEESFVRRQK